MANLLITWLYLHAHCMALFHFFYFTFTSQFLNIPVFFPDFRICQIADITSTSYCQSQYFSKNTKFKVFLTHLWKHRVNTSNTWEPGVEPAAPLAAQCLPGVPGYMRDTVKINRGPSPIIIRIYNTSSPRPHCNMLK